MHERIIGRRAPVEEEFGLNRRDEVAVVGVGYAVIVDNGTRGIVEPERVVDLRQRIGHNQHRREMPRPQRGRRHFLLTCRTHTERQQDTNDKKQTKPFCGHGAS